MITIKKDNHIDETKLDRNESILFIDMLQYELKRHDCEILRAKEKTFYWCSNYNPIHATFWDCQKENHKADSEKIQKCIKYLKEKWGLK